MINYQRDEVVEKITRVRNTLAIYEDEWDKEMELLNEALELLGAKDEAVKFYSPPGGNKWKK